MFRASPWISFQPDTHQANRMDDDVDMDAPQISTLREEETPPPQPVATKKIRKLKLVLKQPLEKPPPSPASSVVKAPGTEDDVDEDEDQEDQLIDDDDDGASAPATVSPSKRKPAAKRKPRKSEKPAPPQEDASEKKGREKGQVPSEEDSKPSVDVVPLSAVPPTLSPAKGGRKRAARKPANPPRPKKAPRLSKPVMPTMPPADEGGVVSDAAFTGTAASSPVTAQIDVGSPDPESDPIQLPPAAVSTPEEPSLENVPLPVYPLPSKPFPVQHPPKIGTGFAPMIPLDRGGRKVRHWRVANREIRGIAGGRWFVRCFVGEKDSEYASAIHSRGDAHGSGSSMALPKLVSISAPSLGRTIKGRGMKGSAAASSGSSRAGSLAPDSTAVRVPTKMRTIVSAAPQPETEIVDADRLPNDAVPIQDTGRGLYPPPS